MTMEVCLCGCRGQVKTIGAIWLKGHCNRGTVRSQEWKLKQREAKLGKPNTALIGRKYSEAHRTAISKSLTGRHLSEEQKLKIRLGNLGKKMSPEAIRKSHLKLIGQKRSLDSRRKMSLSHLGKPSYWKGLHLPDEVRRKISETLKKSPDTPRGANHHNWNGGSSKGYKQGNYKNNRTYRLWRETVYQRDNYTCQSCKQRGLYLTAHHIKSWVKYPDLRFEASNGITLCEPCHSLTDNYRGRG